MAAVAEAEGAVEAPAASRTPSFLLSEPPAAAPEVADVRKADAADSLPKAEQETGELDNVAVVVDDPGAENHWAADSSHVEGGKETDAGLEGTLHPTASGPVGRRARLLRALRDPLVLDRFVYAVVTSCYYVYRSRGSPTFTHHPFQLKMNDLWGVLFVVMFLATRRASYLVYAINPFRNLVLVGLQELIPRLQEYAVAPEFYRDVISASLQLLSALLIKYLVKPQPIGLETEFAKPLPFASRRIGKVVNWIVTTVFVASSLAMVFMGLNTHTHKYTEFLTDHHGWKVLLAVLLGTAEEVTWREAYLDDNNNTLQAFTWGMNHLVVGEGMDNPFVYGLVSFGYAFVLGLSQYRLARYMNHVCVEYLIMDNLVKPVI